MSGAAQLYEEDFVLWAEEQSRALREAAGVGTNLPLDWENLAEEIDSLGRSVRRELRSRISTIIEHLLKLESSPVTDPRRGWTDTTVRERRDIELLLEDSPSLKGDVARVVSEEMQRAVRYATRALLRHHEAAPEAIAQLAAAHFTEEQVLGDWFPGDSSLPANEGKEEPG
jgi:hypothetical protein